ncbi:MAG: 6,7-dimethyl-8-ribityllumazine synthase [Bacteroides sp.]|nr:6,7-dimethyl-8-ribityllumazine synthase [Bacteroides sp.]
MQKGYMPAEVGNCDGLRVAVVSTEWNQHITGKLAEGAIRTLEAAGVETEHFTVPGAVELTFAAQRLSDTGAFDAIIVCGCVIKGDTPHFDYVCQSVTQGITALNTDGPIPVIFSVLTVNTEQQALDRCSGSCGHKGIEGAQTAMAMMRFNLSILDDED